LKASGETRSKKNDFENSAIVVMIDKPFKGKGTDQEGKGKLK